MSKQVADLSVVTRVGLDRPTAQADKHQGQRTINPHQQAEDMTAPGYVTSNQLHP